MCVYMCVPVSVCLCSVLKEEIKFPDLSLCALFL